MSEPGRREERRGIFQRKKNEQGAVMEEVLRQAGWRGGVRETMCQI